jgi:hypothetical protein
MREAETVSLYLCIFDNDLDDDELEGVEVGSYTDFHEFRLAVNKELERGPWGSRFPTLMNHHDSDGQWSPDEARLLERELTAIREGVRSAWPAARAYLDVNGAPLVDRLIELAALSAVTGRPIWFQ